MALGLPCVTADAGTIDSLMETAEREPSTRVTIDLGPLTVLAGGRVFSVGLPPGARESFLDGTWDATPLLLDRYEDVERVYVRLPYVTGF
ncbi:MAG: hypothetical protein LC804_28365 [Acidobacteria bacterium]|nr:hypothetical protein [Acidobacteriota bacterium]